MLRTALALMSLIAAALFAFSASAVKAHGNPEITVNPNPAPAGSTITIEGMEFDENDEISLTLEGVTGTIALGMAMTDAEGAFHLEVTLPDTAGPGSYQIKAESSDATALADFRITAAAGGPQPPFEHERALDFHQGGPSSEVIALATVMAVFAAAGVALLLIRERAPR